MNGMEIINKLKRETFYEFSEAVPAFGDEIYFIFKADIISIDINPSKSKPDKIKDLIKESTNNSGLISHIDIEPIAYLLKTIRNKEIDYQIEPLDEKYDSIVEKNKDKLLEEFLNRK